MKLQNQPSLPGNCFRVMMLAMMLCTLLVGAPWKVEAQLVESMATGSTSNSLRKQAAARIPYQQMSPAVARRVADVVNKSSLYRQLPVTTIQSDPDMYLFLLRYPESIIGTWRLMGISEMTARRTAAFRLQASDGAGTTTTADLVYGQPNLNIYLADGEYDGPMVFGKVTGSCVIMVESNYHRGPDGQPQVTSCMNFFMKIDNLAASIIARTIHPLVGTTADHNFVETLKFAEKLSGTSARNGPGVQRMAQRVDGLTPEVRHRFQEMAGVVWQRSQSQPVPTAAVQTTGFTEPTQATASYQPAGQPGLRRRPTSASPQSQHYFRQGYHLGDAPQPPQRNAVPGR